MKNFNFELLAKIIEASSAELSEIQNIDDPNIKNFKEARKSYFLNDLKSLNFYLDYFSKESSWIYQKICKDIFQIRIFIRDFKNSSNDINTHINSSARYLNLTEDPLMCLFLIELLAVEAIVCDLAGEQDLSYQKNIMAAEMAHKIGLAKKSSTLHYNAIVALNHKSPQIKISYLVEAIHRAQKARDYNTEIAALTSLAEEYEKLDCYNLSLEECSKAVELARQYCFGSYNFCYVLILSARLAYRVGRFEIAQENIKLAETFEFQEFKEQIEIVKKGFKSNDSKQSLSGDEQKLIQLLTSGPKDKYFLIENLYGQGDTESLDNRLKQLLLRLRKKHKGLIQFNKKSLSYELLK